MLMIDRADPRAALFFREWYLGIGERGLQVCDLCAGVQRLLEVVEFGGVSEDQAILVVQIARHQNLLFGGTENFLVTREFNKIATEEQKLALLDCLFRVAAAEDLISTVESNEISQITSELGLPHEDFVAIRSKYRGQLGVFRT